MAHVTPPRTGTTDILDLTHAELRRLVELDGGMSLADFPATDEDGEMSMQAALFHAVEDDMLRESDPEGHAAWRAEAHAAFMDEEEDRMADYEDVVPRERIVAGMCSTWRHDYGLMDEAGREALRRNMDQIYEHDVGPHLDRLRKENEDLRARLERTAAAVPIVEGEKGSELLFTWKDRMSVSIDEDGVSYAIMAGNGGGWLPGTHVVEDAQDEAAKEIRAVIEAIVATGGTDYPPGHPVHNPPKKDEDGHLP